MKIFFIIITIILLCNEALSQVKKDTINIFQNDIKLILENMKSNNPKIGYFIKKCFVNSITSQPLNGFYKVKLDENSFYTANYENGNKFLSKKPYINIIKYYTKKSLYKLDYYYPFFFSSQKYISISNYKLKSHIFLQGFTKEYLSDKTIDTIRIFQKIKNNTVYWKIYDSNQKKEKIIFIND